MYKLLIQVILIMFTIILFFGCPESHSSSYTDTSSNDDGVIDESEIVWSYINFHPFWSDGSTDHVRVSIYGDWTNTRLLYGSTSPDGNFYSTNRFDTKNIYRVYVHHITEDNCVAEITVNFHANSPWPISENMTDVYKDVSLGPRSNMYNLYCRE